MRFDLCGPSYRSQSVNADGQTCMNLYPEKDESGQGNSDMDLYSTPGLTLWAILNTAGGRGITTIQGRSFAVAGTGFFEILPLNASPNFLHRGDVVSDGQPVSFAGGTTQLLLASVGTAYVFDLITNLLTPVAQLNGIPVAQVAVSDDFFFAMIAGQSKIQSSAFLDATTWPGANFTGIQVFSDNPNGIYVDHRELWIFGPNAIQPYFDSGNFPFPFDAIGGAFIESGLAAPSSVAQCDNSLFWLGADRRGQGIVRRANGYTPVRVSDFGVENAIQSYSRIDDAVGYGYQWFGHEIYRLTFPTADATWEFDAAMGMWHEVGFWNSQARIFSRHRAQFHTANFGQHLVLDGTTGQVYFMDPNNGTDFGNPIRRLRRAPHVSKEQERISINQLQVYLETGLGLATAQQGVDIPTSFTLVDANRVSWRLSIADITITPPTGQIQMTVAPAGAVPDVLQISDPGGTTSWRLAVTTTGVVQTVPIAFDGTLGMGIEFVSQSGFWHYLLEVNAFGVLSPVPAQQSTRAPQLMLRLSDDGGHSWSDEWIADCGKAGEYKARVLYYRLGSYRDFVVELAYSDPTPLRIIDGYLLTDDDPVPQGRLTQEARKRA